MTPKLADLSDIPVILRITDAGRRAQREQGFLQWQDGYPDKAIVESDILLGAGRLLLDGDTPVAYASLIVSDPGYEALGDIWRYSGPYGVIHRMAVSDAYRGKGVSGIFFDFLEADAADKGIKAIRVDTGRENMVMQHILSRRHYCSHGLHTFPWGPRLAYEKLLVSRPDCDDANWPN